MLDISKVTCSVLSLIAFGALAANPAHKEFTQYKPIEAYEVRPGILMIPNYSPDGEVCEIGLEKLHYSPDRISLGSSLSRKDIDQILDELVPTAQRGPRPRGLLERGMTTFEGQGMVSDDEYQNVSIQIYGNAIPNNADIRADSIVATLKWKNRKCR